jgi:hypothetical protein
VAILDAGAPVIDLEAAAGNVGMAATNLLEEHLERFAREGWLFVKPIRCI